MTTLKTDVSTPHDNSNNDARQRERYIYRVTIVGAVCNVLLSVLKLVAGIVGRSSAMVADGMHSLSDLVTDAVVIVFVRMSSKPQDRRHEYGHGKYETLATSVIGILLLFVALGIMWDSSQKIWQCLNGNTMPQPSILALVAALASIGVKEWLYRYTRTAGERQHSQAVVANAWHHRSDALSSVGTAIGIGGALALGPHWAVLDPIAAFFVSVLIVRAAIDQLRPSIGELVEDSLPESVEADISKAIHSVPGVTDPHNMRTRKIGSKCAVDVHVRMDGNITLNEAHSKAAAVERNIREVVGTDAFVMVHMEPIKTQCTKA